MARFYFKNSFNFLLIGSTLCALTSCADYKYDRARPDSSALISMKDGNHFRQDAVPNDASARLVIRSATLVTKKIQRAQSS